MARIPIGYRSKTIRVLQFLSFSGRPLGVEELVDAIAVNLHKPIPSFDPLDRMPEPTEIARYCSSLTKFVIKEDDQTTELHLAHFSVKEYLVSSPEHSQDFNEMIARTLIAKVCLSYLRQVEPDLQDVNKFKIMFPFAEYSAKNWMENAAATEKQNETVFEMTVDFLMDFNKTYYRNWTYLHQYGEHEKHDSPFWHACNAGLSIRCLERILEDGKEKGITIEGDEDTVMEYGSGEPLRAASERGHLETMRFLMEKGVAVEDRHLYLPCDHGDEEAVKLLLEYGEMNPWNEWGPEAFARACYNGHLGLVELLIDHCSDFVNISPRYFAQPLMAACEGSRQKVALLLLQRGAKVIDEDHVQGSWEEFETALAAAAARGLESVVKTMIEDYSAAPRWYEFRIAVANEHAGIVQIMWDSGRLKKKDLVRAFTLAIEKGHAGIVEMLWDSERLNKDDLDGALFDAARLGHDYIVPLLLRLGADMGCAWDYEGRSETPLEVARRLRQEKVVAVILQAGAKEDSEVQYDGSDEELQEDKEDEEDQDDKEDQDGQEFNEDQEPDEGQESEKNQDFEEDRGSEENRQVDEGQGRDNIAEADTVSSNPTLDAEGSQKNCSKRQKGSLRIDGGLLGSGMRDENLGKDSKDQGPELDDPRHHRDNFDEECNPRVKNGKTLDTYVGNGKPDGQAVANRATLKSEEGSQRGEGDDEQNPAEDRNESKQVTERARDSRRRNRSCGWIFACLNPSGGKVCSLSVTCWITETSS